MSAELKSLEKNLSEKQQQINCLFKITQAINLNDSADTLFSMYSDYLRDGMGIEKMVFFTQEENEWAVASEINFEYHPNGKMDKVLSQYKDVTELNSSQNTIVAAFDYIVPVLHKDLAIAYVLLKDSKTTQDRLNFITTITNIIAVAIENKRLFKRQIDQERYRKEVELASEVQKMLIPGKFPRRKYLELSSIYKPHLNIGGDYYDFIEIDENSFIFCIADISGKGVAAALLMANFQATLRNAIMHNTDLVKLVQYLNKMLVQLTNSDKIITLFVAEFNTCTRTLSYVNAGHAPPFLVTKNTMHRLDSGCTLLGAFDDLPQIQLGQLTLESDTLIMAYTDGLTDLINDEGVYFDDKLLSDFLQHNAQHTADLINKKLLESMETFKGEQDYPDDIAILTCKLHLSLTE